MEQHTIAHNNAAWRERANFVIRADLGQYGHLGRAEQLWVKQKEAFVFEMCCLPFFTYGVALGDLVTTDEAYTLRQAIVPSGRRMIRVAFAKSDPGTAARDAVREAIGPHTTCEWYSLDYVAIDVPTFEEARRWEGVLEPLAFTGGLVWEFGSEAPPPPQGESGHDQPEQL